MTCHLHFAWDFGRWSTAAAIHVTEAGGGTATFTYSSGVYAHVKSGTSSAYFDPDSTGNTIRFPNDANAAATGATFISQFISDINTHTGLAGTYALSSFSGTRYTLTSNTSFHVLGNSTNILGAGLLGMHTGTSAFSATLTSVADVLFSKSAAHGYLSDVTDEYEMDGASIDAETDANFGGGITWERPPIYQDFTLPLEAVADVFRFRSDLYAHSVTKGSFAFYGNDFRWTWQHAWEHARNLMPFMVVTDPVYYVSGGVPYVNVASGTPANDSSKISVHKMRADGARWNPQRAVADYDGLWNLRFLTRIEERAGGIA